MPCSICGTCCKYLVFTVNTTLNDARRLLSRPVLSFIVNKDYNADELRYLNIRLVKVDKEKDTSVLTLQNKHCENNMLEVIKRGKYRLIIYTPCPLLNGNLCSIWDTKPDVCDYKKCTLELWRPRCCTDTEE